MYRTSEKHQMDQRVESAASMRYLRAVRKLCEVLGEKG